MGRTDATLPTMLVRQASGPPKPYPMIFVHGAWHGAWCWDEFFLEYFAQHGYTAIAFDLRQHGNRVDPRRLRGCRLDDYVADLLAVTESLATPFILMGHSMGGLVVQKFLEQNNAQAAILLAPVPIHGAVGAALRTLRRAPWPFLKMNLQLRLYPMIESETLAREAFFMPDIDPARLKQYYARLQDESYLAFLDMMLFRLPQPKRVQTPMLVLGAENDAIFAPAEIRRTAQAYGTEAIIYPDMAHDMMLADRWQEVADASIEWLQRQGL